MIARAPLTLLLAPLLLVACFGDTGGAETGSTSAATGSTSAAATQDTGDDSTTTGTGEGTTEWTTAEPPTSTTTTTTGTTDEPDPITTGEPDPGTTGEGNPGCADYCAAMMGSCLGEHGQYPSLDSCIGACAGLPAGSPGQTSGNSLACRAYHAGMASIAPEVHCVHAGPGGAGACGQNCDGFCAIATSVCPAEHASEAECLATCAGFMDTEPYNIDDAAGDTLACRLYHLAVAATSPSDAEVHCGHTVLASPPCK